MRVTDLLLLLLFCSFISCDFEWEKVDNVVQGYISKNNFPGASVLVANKDGILYSNAYGHYTYNTSLFSPKIHTKTLFDMASVTKVLITTTAIAQFYQRGELDLDSKIIEFLPMFYSHGKKDITVRHLLLHNSGLPPDPYPGYCQKFVYSDLSMITLMYVIGELARQKAYIREEDIYPGCPLNHYSDGSQQCFFEAYVRKFIINASEMSDSTYLPPDPLKCAPTLANDTRYRHVMIQGVVHDENTYSMGGISGHAGFFAHVDDIEKILRLLMFPEDQKPFSLLGISDQTTKLFTTVYNISQSTRALGWDTNADGKSSCGTLSNSTYFHTGYTGTQICNDPQRGLFTIFLTNRVYPDDTKSVFEARKAFNSMVQQVYDDGMRLKNNKLFAILGAIFGLFLLFCSLCAGILIIVISPVIQMLSKKSEEKKDEEKNYGILMDEQKPSPDRNQQ